MSKGEVLRTINFESNYQLIANVILEWSKTKPLESSKYIDAVTEMYFHINELRIENRELQLEVSDIKYKANKQNMEFYNFKNKTNGKIN
tara:strand:- start:10519 stop:10785 length:267 start_codon:yes stop_codon:yes gene_type:complete